MNSLTFHIRSTIAATGLNPDTETAIAQFASCGPWSTNYQRLKSIVLGEMLPTQDDVPAIAYTLARFTNTVVDVEEIQRML